MKDDGYICNTIRRLLNIKRRQSSLHTHGTDVHLKVQDSLSEVEQQIESVTVCFVNWLYISLSICRSFVEKNCIGCYKTL